MRDFGRKNVNTSGGERWHNAWCVFQGFHYYMVAKTIPYWFPKNPTKMYVIGYPLEKGCSLLCLRVNKNTQLRYILKIRCKSISLSRSLYNYTNLFVHAVCTLPLHRHPWLFIPFICPLIYGWCTKTPIDRCDRRTGRVGRVTSTQRCEGHNHKKKLARTRKSEKGFSRKKGPVRKEFSEKRNIVRRY